MMDSSSTLWTLERAGRRTACLVRLEAFGIEIDIAHDGEVQVTRAFETADEAMAWADAKRAAREAEGWQPLPPGAPSVDRRYVF